jgi:hypothetical protein
MQRDASWLQRKLWRDNPVLGGRTGESPSNRQEALNRVMGQSVVKYIQFRQYR